MTKLATYPALETPVIIAITGKIASGKDTIGAGIMDRLGISDKSLHLALATQLKAEVKTMMDLIRYAQVSSFTQEETIAFLAYYFPGVSTEDLSVMVNALWTDVLEGVSSAYARTDGVRRALQYWGTDVRRKQNDNYWVDHLVRDINNVIVDKRSAYVTDARFPNEVDAVRNVGGLIVRIDISPEVQAQRLWERDQIVMSDEKRLHPSETSLDDYTDFDVRIVNEGITIDEAINQIIEQLAVAQRNRSV